MIERRSLLAVLIRPALWIEGARAAAAVSRDGWWRSGLPRPDPAYTAWRVATAYGSPDATVAPEDLVAYLRWRKLQRTVRNARGG